MAADRIIAALFAAALAFSPPIAFAQSSPIAGFPPGLFDNLAARSPAPSGGASYSDLGGFTSNNALTFTKSVPISAGFCVVLVLVEKAVASTATVTVSGTLLNQDKTLFTSGSFLVAAYSGSVSASSTNNVVITGGVTFGDMTFGIWSWPGTGTLNSSASGTGANVSLAVTSGNYLFAIQNSNSSWTGSTQAVTNAGPGTPYTIVGADLTETVADWSIISTNATFTVASTSGFTQLLAVDYTHTP